MHKHILTTTLAAVAIWGSQAIAQSYPEQISLTINDHADLLAPAAEATLSEQLDRLRHDTGVQMTVVTLPVQSPYAPRLTMEKFATQLFNAWAIGGDTRTDGVLVLLLQEERAIRLELGAAYARDWDRVAKGVVDNHFLPGLKDNDYARGLSEGTEATIQKIIAPFRAGHDAPRGSGSGLWVLVVLLGLPFALRLLGNKAGDMFALTSRCPDCACHGIRVTRRVIHPPGLFTDGTGQKCLTCDRCGYARETEYVIAKHARSFVQVRGGSGGSGGRSGGGGASGRF